MDGGVDGGDVRVEAPPSLRGKHARIALKPSSPSTTTTSAHDDAQSVSLTPHYYLT